MKQYCELCEKHCPMEDLGCGEGRRAYAAEALLDELDAGEPRMDMEIDLDEREAEAHRPPSTLGEPVGPDGHHPPFPPHEGPGPHGSHHPPYPPHEGPGPHGPHHPPFPPHEGPGPRGPHPRPPRFDPEELMRQAEGASTLELFDLCHRVLHRPGAGAMRGQGRALAMLAGRGEMSQRELQELLRVAPGSMSELLAKLERKGLLARERSDDRRSNLLKITDAGREAAAKVEAPGDELFSALSVEQREQFAEMLKLLLADWLRRIERDPAERPE